MPKYLNERLIPEADKLTPQELVGIAEKSRSVLNEMGPRIQWIQSVVTADGIYCRTNGCSGNMRGVAASPPTAF